MENERSVFRDDKQKKQKKQSKIVQILHKEKSQLLHQLDAIKEGAHAKKDSEFEYEAEELYEELESSQKLLESEKGNLWELESHVKKVYFIIDA